MIDREKLIGAVLDEDHPEGAIDLQVEQPIELFAKALQNLSNAAKASSLDWSEGVRRIEAIAGKAELDRKIDKLMEDPEFCTALAMITYNDRDPLNLTYSGIFGPLPRWGRAIAKLLPAPWSP